MAAPPTVDYYVGLHVVFCSRSIRCHSDPVFMTSPHCRRRRARAPPLWPYQNPMMTNVATTNAAPRRAQLIRIPPMIYVHALYFILLARECSGFGRSTSHAWSNALGDCSSRMQTSTRGGTRTHRIRSNSSYQPNQSQLYSSAVAVDVVKLKYTEYSKPSDASSSSAITKPPVLIVHGLLGQSRNFASLAQSLAAQLQFKRRIIAVDLRNHGESGHADSMSYTAQAQDLLKVMDREGMEEAVLVGHSMGGKVVKAAALLHPDRVAGLVVMDISPVRYETHEAHWGSVKETIESIVGVDLDSCGGGKRDVDMALRSSIADPALRAFILTNLNECRDTGELSWKINIESIASELDGIAGFEICNPDGSSIEETEGGLVYTGDVLFIKGGASKFVQNSHLETIQSYFPNYLLTSIRSAGHWLHAEAPEDTTAMLKRYLDR